MKEKLPININILIWARTSLGLSLEEVARRMNKEAKVIESWEHGAESPTYPQLEQLAHDIYKRPVAVFFFPVPPKEEPLRTEFRTLPDTLIEKLPNEIIKTYRKAKLFQLYLEELYEGKKPVAKNIVEMFSLEGNRDIRLTAQALRTGMQISIQEQSSWQSSEIAFKKWRRLLELNGIYVFKDAFHNEEYSGFCLHHDLYPIIYVNNSMSDSRQVFTLFHELAHLLFKSGGIDFRDSSIPESFVGKYKSFEVNCNRFANEFLVPAKIFDSFETNVSETQIKHLAMYFSVSREVILRNYLDRGLIGEYYYSKMVAKWSEEAKDRSGKSEGGQYYYTQKTYLGEHYISLAFSKYYQNKIPIDTLSEYLNVKIENITNFEHYALGRGV